LQQIAVKCSAPLRSSATVSSSGTVLQLCCSCDAMGCSVLDSWECVAVPLGCFNGLSEREVGFITLSMRINGKHNCNTTAIPLQYNCNTNAARTVDMRVAEQLLIRDTTGHDTETHYNTLHHCNTLQHTAAHCNTLQHTATPRHHNTLQRRITHCTTTPSMHASV